MAILNSMIGTILAFFCMVMVPIILGFLRTVYSDIFHASWENAIPKQHSLNEWEGEGKG